MGYQCVSRALQLPTSPHLRIVDFDLRLDIRVLIGYEDSLASRSDLGPWGWREGNFRVGCCQLSAIEYPQAEIRSSGQV